MQFSSVIYLIRVSNWHKPANGKISFSFNQIYLGRDFIEKFNIAASQQW